MTPPGFPISAVPRYVATCAECRASLAPDQRYCVSCGARCVPLPLDLMAVAATAVAAGPMPLPDGPLGPGASAESRAAAFLATLPPRAAALAVMSMLAFGVVVGSGATSLATTSQPMVVAYAPSQATMGAPASAASTSGGGLGGGGGGGGGGTTTVVQTVAAQTITAPGGGSTGGGGGGGGAVAPAAPSRSALPPVKHVFVVMLSNQGFKSLYGPSSAFPYLAHTLRKQGELLDNYYGVAGSPLANGVAMISGQGPTQQTIINCPQYTAITPGTLGKGKQTQGDGCVYPSTAQSLPDQLTANGQTWKAYVEGMSTAPAPGAPGGSAAGTTTGTTTSTGASGGSAAGTTSSTTTSAAAPAAGAPATGSPSATTTNIPAGGQPACRHPNLGTADADQTASSTSPYVTWRNPFVYFQSITQSTSCALEDVSLQRLAKDLRRESTTPSLAYIAPSPCDDGSEVSCATGRPADPMAAAAATDALLKTAISEIRASPAYRNGGLIAITADNAPQSGPQADSSACCNNPVYPNLPVPTTTSGSSTTSGTTTAGVAPGTTTTGAGSSTTTTTTGADTTSTGPTSTTTTTTSTTTAAPVTGGQTTPTGGGGQVGLLLLSKYVKPDSVDTLDYFNHYSLLGSIEQLFSLSRLGYASDPQLTLFTTGVVYNAFTG